MKVRLTNMTAFMKAKFDIQCEAAFTNTLKFELGNENVTMESIGETIKNAFDKVIAAIKSFLEKVGKFFKSIWNWIKRHWNAFVSKFTDNKEVEVVDTTKIQKSNELLVKAAEAEAKGDEEEAAKLTAEAAEVTKDAVENKTKKKLTPKDVEKIIQESDKTLDSAGRVVKILEDSSRSTVSKTYKGQTYGKQPASQQMNPRDEKGKRIPKNGRKQLQIINKNEQILAMQAKALGLNKAKAADPSIEEDPAVKQLAAAMSAEHDALVA